MERGFKVIRLKEYSRLNIKGIGIRDPPIRLGNQIPPHLEARDDHPPSRMASKLIIFPSKHP